MRAIKEKIEATKVEEQKAQREGDLNKAAELRYGTLTPTAERIAKRPTRNSPNCKTIKRCSRKKSTPKTSPKWSPNGPAFQFRRCSKARSRSCSRWKTGLKLRVVGQENAIIAVSNAVRRARAGLQDQNRPIGSFIFLGPTGVGKTELCRALAEFLFDDEQAMVRLDMSEYHGKTLGIAADRRPSRLCRL